MIRGSISLVVVCLCTTTCSSYLEPAVGADGWRSPQFSILAATLAK